MMERTKITEPLSKQMKRKIDIPVKKKGDYDGDFGTIISTGSTLLDLAISGGRVRGGGLPGGILVEAFGASGSGKTVLLSEIAGRVQRQGGEIIFHDPEARLNKRFAELFDLKLNDKDYHRPNTVTEVFETVRKWKPEDKNKIHGVFADSLAALSTDLEMGDGDPFGGRRAKEFSEQLRVTCRLLADKNYLMVCSNQVRDVIGATQYQEKTKSPGGRALEFYPSLRLAFSGVTKLTNAVTVAKKEIKRVIGIKVNIAVYKNSIWEPYRTAPVNIVFKYGIDDIAANIQFIKDYTNYTTYTLGGESLAQSIEAAIKIIEQDQLEKQLKEQVIDLWEDIESKFETGRKSKR